MKILMLLDLQNDFLKQDGRLPIHADYAERIIDYLNNRMDYSDFDEVISIENSFSKYDLIGNLFRNWSAISESEGQRFDDRLNIKPNKRFYKSFPNALSNRALKKYLKDNKIDSVSVAGVFTHQCVLSTIKGLLKITRNISLIPEACGASTVENHNKGIAKIKELGVKLTE